MGCEGKRRVSTLERRGRWRGILVTTSRWGTRGARSPTNCAGTRTGGGSKYHGCCCLNGRQQRVRKSHDCGTGALVGGHRHGRRDAHHKMVSKPDSLQVGRGFGGTGTAAASPPRHTSALRLWSTATANGWCLPCAHHTKCSPTVAMRGVTPTRTLALTLRIRPSSPSGRGTERGPDT